MVFGEIGHGSDDMVSKQAVIEHFTSAAVAKAMPNLRGVTWWTSALVQIALTRAVEYSKGACFMIAGGCAAGDVKSFFRSLR